jgi:hypothetical protein
VGASADIGLWLRIAGIALVSGALIGWTAANIPLESLTVGDWLRSLAWAAVALISPIATAAALAKGSKAPTFAQLLGRSPQRPQDLLVLTLGILLIALSVLSVQGALGLVFDPRYRDFPFAPLIGAAAPFLLLGGASRPNRWLKAPAAETVAAATLAAAAVYIVLNEGLANWQASWFSAGVLAVALILVQERVAPS